MKNPFLAICVVALSIVLVDQPQQPDIRPKCRDRGTRVSALRRTAPLFGRIFPKVWRGTGVNAPTTLPRPTLERVYGSFWSEFDYEIVGDLHFLPV